MGGPGSSGSRIRKYTGESPAKVLSDFHVTDHGLTDEEVRSNRERFGENILLGRRSDTALYRLRRAFLNPFSAILLAIAAISFLTDVILDAAPTKSGTTVLILLGMVFLSGILRFSQEMRAKRTADRLRRLVDASVKVRRGGAWRELPPAELAVGDLVRLDAGDRVPADLKLVSARDLFVSEAALTGESGLTEKSAACGGKDPRDPGKDAQVSPQRAAQTARQPADHEKDGTPSFCDIVFSGSTVAAGSGTGVVLAVGRDTVYGAVRLEESRRKNGFDLGAASIAWVLIRFMAVLVPAVFIVCGLTKGDWLAAFLFSLSVAVGLTPEMLPMVINACLVRGSLAMGGMETVVKNINAMQGLGGMDVLCVDKTGTLTGDVISLEYFMDILGNESRRVLDFAYLASLYHTGVANGLDDAILRCGELPESAEYFAALSGKYRKLDERPFDYSRRFSSALAAGPDGRFLIVKGDVDPVCSRCSRAAYGGETIPFEESGREDAETPGGSLKSVHAVVDELLDDGMKVLAVAVKPMARADSYGEDDERDLILLGYLAFFDAPKKTAAEAIRRLSGLKVDIKVLTGDRPRVAVSVCRRLGLPAESLISGDQLDAMTDDDLSLNAEKTVIFAGLSPRQKARIVAALQQNGHTVGYLGDGLNDLPAMAEADVGISVDNAAEAIQETADVILLKKDLNVLERGILEGRRAFANMSKYIRITASSNFGNICSIAAAGVFLPFLPMTAVQLLLLNLLYDTLCLALPWDRTDPELCARPRPWSGESLGRFMRFFGPLSSVFDLLTFAFLYFILCPGVLGADFSVLTAPDAREMFTAVFRTGWFLESMWTQVLILQLLRTERLPFIQSRPSAQLTAVTVLGVILLTALVFTPVGALMGLVPLPPRYFVFLMVIVTAYLGAVTAAKSVFLKKYHRLV